MKFLWTSYIPKLIVFAVRLQCIDGFVVEDFLE